MNISPELLQKFNTLKAGKVYYGEFAKDSSEHAAIVVTVHNEIVHYFCFTSQELTVKRYTQKDPLASVSLTKDESDLIFGAGSKQTYIYCGRNNWGHLYEKEFLQFLSSGRITLKAELPSDLFERIKTAIKSSKTMTKTILDEIGL